MARPGPDSEPEAVTPEGVAEDPESPRARVNRRWNEVLQETRVAQTGVQILFAFLLSIAFTQRFTDLDGTNRAIYTVTVVLGAAATGSLIAPVSIHRFLSGHRMKDEVVEVAGRLMICGMMLLALTVASTLLLVLHMVMSSPLAEILVGLVVLWFVLCWYVLPALLRRKAAGRRRADAAIPSQTGGLPRGRAGGRPLAGPSVDAQGLPVDERPGEGRPVNGHPADGPGTVTDGTRL